MTVIAYVLIQVNSGSEEEVCEKIVDFEEVADADELYGEYDALLKVQTKDLADLREFLTSKLRAIPAILYTSTMIVSKQYKEQ